MSSISTQIIEKLISRILEQEVINQTLCEIIVDAGLISQEDLKHKVNSNFAFIENTVNDLNKKVEEELEFLPYYGKPGEA